MTGNGSKGDLDKLLDRVDALKEKVEANPRMAAAFSARMADADFVAEMRQSARQKVLAERGIEPSKNEIDADWLAEQIDEAKIDAAMLLAEVFCKTIKANTRAGFKALGMFFIIPWRALTKRRKRRKRG